MRRKMIYNIEATHSLTLYYVEHIYVQMTLLNSSDIKMVPKYGSYGSAGVTAVSATIFMSAG